METFVNSLFRRFAPRIGWPLGLLLFAAATSPALAVSGAQLALPAEPIFWAGLGGAIVGLRAARAPRLAHYALAVPASCLLAATLLAALGRALPPPDLLWADLSVLFGTVGEWWRSGGVTAGVELLSGRFLAASLPRLARELLAAPDGGERGAALIVTSLAIVGTLVGAHFLGWATGARRPTLAWSAPLLIALAATTILSGSSGAGLVIGLALLLVLALASGHLAREQGWEREGTLYSEELRWGTLSWGAFGGVVVLGLALMLPTAIPTPIARLLQPPGELPSGLAAIEQAVQSGAPPPQPTADIGLSQLPAVSLGVSLEQGPPEQLALRVATLPLEPGPWPRYWRARVLNRYTGRSWAADARRGPFFPLPTGGPAPTGAIIQEIEDLRPGRGLVIAQPEVIGLDAPAIAERLADGSIAALSADLPGGPYRVISLPQEQLVGDAGSQTPPPDYGASLTLPRSLPPRVRELAEAISGEASTPLDRALALESYLRELPYSYTVRPVPENGDAVDQFLFEMREGYCTYYASAMAVMARSLGIPARIAVGYATGSYDEAAGVYIVREADAHAWPELLIEGRWLPFEPTPVRPLPARAASEQPPPPIAAPLPVSDPVGWENSIWAAGALIGGGLAVAALLAWASLVYWRSDHSPLERALRRLERLGGRAGVPWPAGATLHEYAGLVEARMGESRVLRGLVAQIELLRYGGRRLGQAEERQLRQAMDEVTRWLRSVRRR